ncbi:MAG: hypothetical protein AAF871_10035 [Pseudomonadota bacterium]
MPQSSLKDLIFPALFLFWALVAIWSQVGLLAVITLAAAVDLSLSAYQGWATRPRRVQAETKKRR